jgi:hypothetical protein
MVIRMKEKSRLWTKHGDERRIGGDRQVQDRTRGRKRGLTVAQAGVKKMKVEMGEEFHHLLSSEGVGGGRM